AHGIMAGNTRACHNAVAGQRVGAAQGVALFPELVVRVAISARWMATTTGSVVAMIVAIARRRIAAAVVALLELAAAGRCEQFVCMTATTCGEMAVWGPGVAAIAR